MAAATVGATTVRAATGSTVCVGVEGTSIAMSRPAVGCWTVALRAGLTRGGFEVGCAGPAAIAIAIAIGEMSVDCATCFFFGKRHVLTCCSPRHCHSRSDLLLGVLDQLHPCSSSEVREPEAGHGGEEGCRCYEARARQMERAWSHSDQDHSCSKNQPCWVVVCRILCSEKIVSDFPAKQCKRHGDGEKV